MSDEQVLLGRGWYLWEVESIGERAWVGEYSTNSVYTYMYMEKWHMLKQFQEWGERGIKEMGGEGEFKCDIVDIL
jgi:hypothetical protein